MASRRPRHDAISENEENVSQPSSNIEKEEDKYSNHSEIEDLNFGDVRTDLWLLNSAFDYLISSPHDAGLIHRKSYNRDSPTF